MEKAAAGDLKRESLADISQPIKPAQLQPYNLCSLDANSLGADSFLSSSYTSLILEQLKKVIQDEGPISRSLLAKRILQAWGISRLGTKLDQRFTEVLSKLKPKTTEVDGMKFFWPESVDPAEYGIFRVSADESQRRAAEDLPPEEVAVAIKVVLAAQISLPQEELIKQVVKILGYARSGSALDKAIRHGIQKAVELDFVIMNEQRVVAK